MKGWPRWRAPEEGDQRRGRWGCQHGERATGSGARRRDQHLRDDLSSSQILFLLSFALLQRHFCISAATPWLGEEAEEDGSLKERDWVAADLYRPPHMKRRRSLARRNGRSQGGRWHGRCLDLDRRRDGDDVSEVVTMSAYGHIPRRQRLVNGPGGGPDLAVGSAASTSTPAGFCNFCTHLRHMFRSKAIGL